MKYRAVVKHRSLDKDLQTWGLTLEYIDSWLRANEALIPNGAIVEVFELTEVSIKRGVIGTIDGEEGSRLEKAGLLKENTEKDDKKGAKRK